MTTPDAPDIAIAGGHGQIAMQLTELLVSSRTAAVRSMIRDGDQATDITDVGGTPVVLDLESAQVDEVADAIRGCDAVVFAAGAGAGSGAERKESVDYGAAVLLLEACQRAGVGRYLMISSMGTDDPPQDDDVFSIYLRAKARADRALMDSDLSWTVLRPGRLTDDDATGEVRIARHVPRGEIPRADVAGILSHLISHPEQADRLLVEAIGGGTPIADAVAGAADARDD